MPSCDSECPLRCELALLKRFSDPTSRSRVARQTKDGVLDGPFGGSFLREKKRLYLRSALSAGCSCTNVARNNISNREPIGSRLRDLGEYPSATRTSQSRQISLASMSSPHGRLDQRGSFLSQNYDCPVLLHHLKDLAAKKGMIQSNPEK